MENFEKPPQNTALKTSIPKSLDVESKTIISCDGIKSEMTVGFSVTKGSCASDSPTTTISQILHDPSTNTSTTSSQIPWQDKVQLFTPRLTQQMLLPEYSKCLATQAILKMCNLGFEIEEKPNAEAMSPTKTVPFIKVDKYVVGELEGIIQFLNNKSISLSDKLDHDQKINLNAFMDLTNNTLKLVELYISWVHQKTYKKVTRIKYGSVYPWPLNWIQNIIKRNEVLKLLKSFEWNGKTLAEVLFELDRYCDAVNQRLGGEPYFFEGGDTELDACVFGHLFAILNTPLPGNHLSDAVKSYPELIKLVNRIKKEYF